MEAPPPTQALIAKAVKARMDAAGWSENAMAQATGIPQTTLNRNLRGDATPFNVDQLGRIAEVLGVTLAHLIEPRRAA